MTTTHDRHATAHPTVTMRLVELACLAPSVHNTQPWRWRVRDNEVRLYADLDRQLRAQDPLGRDLVISCGAALHHYQFAARALGWDTEVQRGPTASDPTQLARVTLMRGPDATVSAEDIDVLRRRCTDRRRFTAWPVPAEQLDHLADEATRSGARAFVVSNMAARFRLELVVNRAAMYRHLDPVATEEQQAWVGRGRDDGVPLEVLPRDPEVLGRTSRFGAGVVEDARLPIMGGDGIIALGGEGDDTVSWIRTGEALSALWLEATRTGLSVVPLSQPVEVDITRHELREQVLDGAFVPHILVRIGWQPIGRSELPRTPRRALRDVLCP